MNKAPADTESEEILDLIQNYTITFSKYTYRSALAQFYLANKWAKRHERLGLISTVLSVLATTSLLSGSQSSLLIFQFSITHETVAGILALLASIGIATSTFLNPNRRSQEHYNAATSFLDISDKARLLSEVESRMGKKTDEGLKKELFELVEKRGELTKNSPRIPTTEWDDAKEGVLKHFERARETIYVTMKVNDMPISPIHSVKMICSGGCGDKVWVDKRVEKRSLMVPVLCMECALKKMESARASEEDITFDIVPESTESLMNLFMEKEKAQKNLKR